MENEEPKKEVSTWRSYYNEMEKEKHRLSVQYGLALEKIRALEIEIERLRNSLEAIL